MEKPKESLFVKLLSKRFVKASIEVSVGLLIVFFLAKPFMMNIELMAVSAGVPSFYVVFTVIPLSRNLKNALSAHFCRKKDKAIIPTFFTYFCLFCSLFDKFDVNKDGKLQISELREVTVEFGMLGRLNCDIPELVTTLLVDFDKDKDGEIDEIEFEEGIEKWLKEYKFDFENNGSR